MKRKIYSTPKTDVAVTEPTEILVLSIIESVTADPNADVLVKRDDWDIFGDNAADGSADDNLLE